jgi:glycerol-3-phosphate O-acyltransferase/dihydroxyacetone phosphate acyltransferase
MITPGLSLYSTMRSLVRLALGFYFRRIERFHSERVPDQGPVLFTSNHPNSLTDSFIIGTSVPRKVNFVATVQLFRFTPLKALFTRCGVIPINRVKDDPRAMRTVAETFEACYRALEQGEAVGIFPEGITYDDAQLKEIKSGAARMALELEHRHEGRLGLKILPTGLTYSAKELYRSDALIHFGEPIVVAGFLEGYNERRKECIQRLTSEIEHRLQMLIMHLPQLEHARLVEGIKRLYLDQLVVANSVLHEPVSPRAEELLLSQAIVQVVEQVYQIQPGRAAAFAARLDSYERRLAQFKISDDWLADFPEKGKWMRQTTGWALVALIGLPVAIYGWLHRLLPFAVVGWAVYRFPQAATRKAQTSTTAITAGIVAFGAFYAAYVLVFTHFFGWPWSLWYALSLPPASLLAHYYWRQVRYLARSVRTALILLQAPLAAKRLIAMRNNLITEIEGARAEYRGDPSRAT